MCRVKFVGMDDNEKELVGEETQETEEDDMVLPCFNIKITYA